MALVLVGYCKYYRATYGVTYWASEQHGSNVYDRD